MTLLAYGINHQTAPLQMRERLAVLPERLPSVLRLNQQHPHLPEVSILSTCNRTEWYCFAKEISTSLLDWLLQPQGLKHAELGAHSYLHTKEEAYKHLLRVGSGLDSMMLGETQILGQLKNAYRQALETGTIGIQLKQVFPAVFRACKRIRTASELGVNPLSIASVGLYILKRVYVHFSDLQVLLIGCSQTNKLMFKQLQKLGIQHFTLLTRYPKNAAQFRKQQGDLVHVASFSALQSVLPNVDVVISATHSEKEILFYDQIKEAMHQRHMRRLILFDLGLPRNIETFTTKLESVFLYNLMDLQDLAKQFRAEKERAALRAEELVLEELQLFEAYLKQQKTHHLIKHYRTKMAHVAQKEMVRAKSKIQNGFCVDEIFQDYAHRLLNKMMHPITRQIHHAGLTMREELLDCIEFLFDQEECDT